MNSISTPHTVPEDRPIDPAILHILTVVNRVATEQGCPYIVVGATARDLLLHHVFGIPAIRATRDVDFAIAVENWEKFQGLRDALLATNHFAPSKVKHRLFFKTPTGTTDIPIDLIPFGGVAEDDTIAWPPEKDTVLTVAGFEDALVASVQVKVNVTLTLPVVSLAALAILKLFAWQDRKTTDKDALDLYRVISTYADAGNTDRLYDSKDSPLEQLGYDLELAGAALAGDDGRRLSSQATLTRLRIFLTSAVFVDTLAERIRTSWWPLQPEQLPRIRTMLSTFSEHLLTRSPSP
jgi:predicted nucleotidyltransferase